MNPVEEGLVFTAENYMYSSAIDYAGEKGMLEVFFLDPPLERLGNMRSIE